MSKPFNSIGSGRMAQIPIPLLILIAVAVGFHIFLNYSDAGRNVFAIGGNAIAARIERRQHRSLQVGRLYAQRAGRGHRRDHPNRTLQRGARTRAWGWNWN